MNALANVMVFRHLCVLVLLFVVFLMVSNFEGKK